MIRNLFFCHSKAEWKEVGAIVITCARHLLRSTHFYRSVSGVKVMDATTGWGEPSDRGWEIAPASFKSDTWKRISVSPRQ